jgi:hypothetical protein
VHPFGIAPTDQEPSELLIFVNSDGKLAALLLMDLVESWNMLEDSNRSTDAPSNRQQIKRWFWSPEKVLRVSWAISQQHGVHLRRKDRNWTFCPGFGWGCFLAITWQPEVSPANPTHPDAD